MADIKGKTMPERSKGFSCILPFKGGEYPAIPALAGYGERARIPLTVFITSGSGSTLERNHAADAVLASFYKTDFIDGIRYLRDAENLVGPDGSRNLESVLHYLETVPACLREKEECAAAMHGKTK